MGASVLEDMLIVEASMYITSLYIFVKMYITLQYSTSLLHRVIMLKGLKKPTEN